MAVEVGDTAPDFVLRDQNNEEVALSSYRGRQNVVLIFYPLAFTNVCSGELCSLRDDLSSFQNDAIQLLTVSVDSSMVHKVWADQEGFDFPLLADFWPHGEVARAYGVLNEERGLALRGTFVIDKQGVVRWKVVNQMPDARDQAEYLEALAALD